MKQGPLTSREANEALAWKGLQKEKQVRVVPFAKHQITSGPGLKQITFRLALVN